MRAENITHVDGDSFGPGSAFAHLHRLGGKLVFFGAPFQVCTFVHYIEQSLGVPYRYFKEFSGRYVRQGVSGESKCTFYVRRLDANVVTDLTRFERELAAQGALKCARIGSGEIKLVTAADAFDVGRELLRQDIFAFLRESPEAPNTLAE